MIVVTPAWPALDCPRATSAKIALLLTTSFMFRSLTDIDAGVMRPERVWLFLMSEDVDTPYSVTTTLAVGTSDKAPLPRSATGLV